MKAKQGKQKWEPGKKVTIGGRDYVVKHQEAKPAKKGEAAAWIIATADGSREYSWVPFRGLRLTSGQPLVRPRVRHKATDRQPEATPAPAGSAQTMAILAAVTEDIVAHPREGASEFLSRILGLLGVGRQAPAAGGKADGAGMAPDAAR